MISMRRYFRSDAAFTPTVDQSRAVHAIAQDSGAEPNTSTCEVQRSGGNIAQTDFKRLSNCCGPGRTGYVSRASIIPPWRRDCFPGPWLQDGSINGGRAPETSVPADDNGYTDADEDKTYGRTSRSVHNNT
jgi:hypothetical protein